MADTRAGLARPAGHAGVVADVAHGLAPGLVCYRFHSRLRPQGARCGHFLIGLGEAERMQGTQARVRIPTILGIASPTALRLCGGRLHPPNPNTLETSDGPV